jgi:hypothetical protein
VSGNEQHSYCSHADVFAGQVVIGAPENLEDRSLPINVQSKVVLSKMNTGNTHYNVKMDSLGAWGRSSTNAQLQNVEVTMDTGSVIYRRVAFPFSLIEYLQNHVLQYPLKGAKFTRSHIDSMLIKVLDRLQRASTLRLVMEQHGKIPGVDTTSCRATWSTRQTRSSICSMAGRALAFSSATRCEYHDPLGERNCTEKAQS